MEIEDLEGFNITANVSIVNIPAGFQKAFYLRLGFAECDLLLNICPSEKIDLVDRRKRPFPGLIYYFYETRLHCQY